jgi:plastocyanin
VLACAAASVVQAANRRISISHYQWSSPEIQIDLGEHVTWYWTGPDTMHSVTGTSANDLGIDSDPGDNLPDHNIGDSFQVAFNTPGTYTFQCKLHSVVRGTVVVSSSPGNPNTEVDPVPQSHVDLQPPYMDGLRLDSSRFSGTKGTLLHLGLDEPGSVDADIYRITTRKHRKKFVGWQRWKAHVGFNALRLGNHTAHFVPRSGDFVAKVRATDDSNNTTPPRNVRFSIAR